MSKALSNSSTSFASELAHFTGTESYHRHFPAMGPVVLTDGAKYFAEKAGAYWLMDIIATELPRLLKKEGFLSITVDSKKGKAKLSATDGNKKAIWKKNIGHTDCPEGEWKFYFTLSNPYMVLMLTSEY